jgi:tyrosyl-tRNA synthetase
MPVVNVESEALQFALARGFFDNCTDLEGLDVAFKSEFMDGNRVKFYMGFDLTAKGLHVGHLSNLMFVRGMLKRGCDVVILLGGGTTYIGDPSGKDETRKMLTSQAIRENKESICKDVLNIVCGGVDGLMLDYDGEVVFESGDGRLMIVDNFYWLMSLGYIEFLREVGVHFSVNKLIKMETFATRLESQKPLSFIEFNYPLLQSYDFYYLNKQYGCNMQIGGSDQWGNIVRGVELIAKMLPENKVFGYTLPLITRSDGKKMGKSEGGAVWLSSDGLSDYDYMQYFRNVDDKDVPKFLRLFTEMEEGEIVDLESEDINRQKMVLAFEATKICRGEGVAVGARDKAFRAFAGHLDDEDALRCDAPMGLVDMLVTLGLVYSKSESRRLIASGGVRINDVVVVSDFVVRRDVVADRFVRPDFPGYDGSIFMLSVGKKKRVTVKI